MKHDGDLFDVESSEVGEAARRIAERFGRNARFTTADSLSEYTIDDFFKVVAKWPAIHGRLLRPSERVDRRQFLNTWRARLAEAPSRLLKAPRKPQTAAEEHDEQASLNAIMDAGRDLMLKDPNGPVFKTSMQLLSMPNGQAVAEAHFRLLVNFRPDELLIDGAKGRKGFVLAEYRMEFDRLVERSTSLEHRHWIAACAAFVDEWHLRLVSKPVQARENGAVTTKALGNASRLAVHAIVAAVHRAQPNLPRHKLVSAVRAEWEARAAAKPKDLGAVPSERHIRELLKVLGHR